MFTRDADFRRGFTELRLALWHALDPSPVLSPAGTGTGAGWLLSEAVDYSRVAAAPGGGPSGDSDLAVSSAEDEAEATRLIALVELARGGDTEAFGMLYDHYHVSVYRFVYYRVGAVALAEDLTSECFFRALRSMGSFRWQGKDFGD